MSPPPRSLTFAVSTSLLTASLSLAGCDEPKKQVNPGPVNEAPDKKADEGGDEDQVNVGPETPPPDPQPEKPPPEPIHVNEGPEPQPEPQPETKTVNPGPEAEKPVPELIEKRVNTRPDP